MNVVMSVGLSVVVHGPSPLRAGLASSFSAVPPPEGLMVDTHISKGDQDK